MRCKWCGKEINEGMYCCKEHDEKYKDYINKRDKNQGKMVFGFMGIMISYLMVMLIRYKLNINRYTYKTVGYLLVMVGLEISLCPYTKQ